MVFPDWDVSELLFGIKFEQPGVYVVEFFDFHLQVLVFDQYVWVNRLEIYGTDTLLTSFSCILEGCRDWSSVVSAAWLNCNRVIHYEATDAAQNVVWLN